MKIGETLKKGVTAHKQGKLKEAEHFYRKVLNLNSKQPDANHNLGVIAETSGKYELALTFYSKAIETHSKDEQHWISFLGALVKSGRLIEARAILYKAKELGLKGDRIESFSSKLNPSTKIDFFYKYMEHIGVFTSNEGEIRNGNLEPKPLLTDSFLNWFETYNWSNKKLLELGSGNSTLYFSKFFESVLSYETNEKWFIKLKSKIEDNVKLQKVDSIISHLKHNTKNINNFEVILIDAGENRAEISEWLIESKFKGIIFFDNSDWSRKSIVNFLNNDFLEIPFFGLKPVYDFLSCTSVIIPSNLMNKLFNQDWENFPKLTQKFSGNKWDKKTN
tara:strand:- start:540 stop:1541 length:1002 start_codon:yes stop_codon:yes gene_type:complete